MNSKILILFLFVFSTFGWAQSEKENLFKDTEELLAMAKQANASFYSPENYNKGLALYRKALKDYSAKVPVETVYNELQSAETFIYKAVERSKINSDIFSFTLQLKKKAEKLAKGKYALKYLEEGESHFTKAIKLSEEEVEKKKIDGERSLANNFFEGAIIIAKNEKLISPVIELKLLCENNNAEIFSPTLFAKGKQRLSDAFLFARANNGEDFMKSIRAAETLFKKSYGISQKEKAENQDLLTAFDFANKAKASRWASGTWNEALETVMSGGVYSEKRNLEKAREKFIFASKLFWDAEKEAIYNHFIKSQKVKLDSLIHLHSEKYAPNLTRRAQLLINLEDEAFARNRYDKKIQRYHKEAADVLRRIEIIVDLYKNGKQKVIDSLVLFNLYPFGNKKLPSPFTQFVAKDTLNFDTVDIKTSGGIISPKKNIFRKNEKIIPQPTNQKVERKNVNPQNSIAKSEKVKPKKTVSVKVEQKLSPKENIINRIRKEFNRKEIALFDEGRKLRLRLTGLKLAAYERKPSRKNLKILRKLRNVIKGSRGIRSIDIEVYSDSWGGDVLNKKLSLVRAKTVRRYLIQLGIKSSLLRAKGIGNKNPIASNDTFAGRNKNRRVEVVFFFK